MTELEKLRVGIARLAQTLDFPLTEIPGMPESWFYGDLCKVARENERGWNKLLACICDEIERVRHESTA